MQKKIEICNLSKKFGDLVVLNNLNFSVYDGEFLCIVGPTGCGKTTFLNLLSGLIEPSEGYILVDGTPFNSEKVKVSFIFQEPSAFPWLTVEQNIRFGMELKGFSKSQILTRTEEILNSLKLVEVRDKYMWELSSSMEQRVIIGRGFAPNPDLLLMDEPYSQMDIKLRYYLEDEVIRFWKNSKVSVIFITHNIEEAVYLADRCLILSPKPTSIKEELVIDLPRPRNISDPKFVEIRDYITNSIRWW